jgi:Ser/Thr protein kinase RdoA (MazF antagonist)
MKPFYELTNRGRALRLRKLALAALEHYDLDVRRLRLVTNDFNGIFRVDVAGGRKYILRVCIPGDAGHTLDEIRSEMMWLAAVLRDTDLGVPEPLATREGTLVTTIETAGVPEPRHCVVFGWMPGPDLAERLNAENLVKLGSLAAQLHTHAETFDPPQGFWVRTKDKTFPYREPVLLFDDAYRHLFPPERRSIYQRAVDRVDEAVLSLYATGISPIVIHNDLHQWNVKVHRGRLYALDFEDLMWGHPVQDIAVTLYYFQGYEDYPALRDAFRRGYTLHRPWPERYPREIEIFIAGRGLDLANLVIQDPDPSYQEMAPEFVERVANRLQAFLAG